MSVYNSILKLPAYFPEGDEYIAMELLAREIQGFASAIGKMEKDPRWTALIMKSWNRPRAALPAMMTLTVKSTKPAGTVSHRSLHCAPASKMEGLSEWITSTLNQHISAHEHVVTSAEDFISKIQEVDAQPDDVMIRNDIDSYFMSDTPHR